MRQKVDALSISIKRLLLGSVIDLKRLPAESVLSAGMGNDWRLGLFVHTAPGTLE
jgi:hypothetical protein